ncbi:MAG: hypothetical protein IPL23_07945 [Saprospiraceae bacterium]|nr:hypothetical protein [Saprospiraceae bacterium]
MKAEAAFIKVTKLLHLMLSKGVIAHMDFTGVSTPDKDAYMASAAVPKTADVLTLSDIMLQKYIAL